MGDKEIKLEQTSKGWDEGADGYVQIMRQGFTSLFAADALEWAMGSNDVTSKVKVIDIAAGTGALSLQAAKKGAFVHSTDFSRKMLDHLESEAKKLNLLSNIKAEVMDGQNLTVGESIYDYAFSIFGVIYFPDQHRGVSEIYRVLKPGGRAAITTWSPNTPLSGILTKVAHLLNPSFSTNTHSNPVTSLSDQQGLKFLFEECGFINVEVRTASHCLTCTINDFISFSHTNPVVVSLRQSMPTDKQGIFDDTIRQVLVENFPNGQVTMHSIAYIAMGSKI